ncbi:MAG: 4a-hydroxytetrahydrobiopterin dehydratase [Candidatus Brocadiia bacterium]
MTDLSDENIDLAEEECVPCRGGIPALEGEELEELADRLDADWSVVDDHHLEKDFEFEDFRQALEFTNRVGELAEEVGHHPEIFLTWGEVGITIWTHEVDGLTKTDFVFAARVEKLYQPGSEDS